MKTLLISPLLAVALLLRCRTPDGCTPVATRCDGSVAQICNADGNWQVLADCDAVSERSGASFVCAYVEEASEDGQVLGHTCVPATDAGTALDAGTETGGVL